MERIAIEINGWDDKGLLEEALTSQGSGFEIDESEVTARRTRHSALGTVLVFLGYIVDLRKLTEKLAELFETFKKKKPADEGKLVIDIKGLDSGRTVSITVSDARNIELRLEELRKPQGDPGATTSAAPPSL